MTPKVKIECPTLHLVQNGFKLSWEERVKSENSEYSGYEWTPPKERVYSFAEAQQAFNDFVQKGIEAGIVVPQVSVKT